MLPENRKNADVFYAELKKQKASNQGFEAFCKS